MSLTRFGSFVRLLVLLPSDTSSDEMAFESLPGDDVDEICKFGLVYYSMQFSDSCAGSYPASIAIFMAAHWFYTLTLYFKFISFSIVLLSDSCSLQQYVSNILLPRAQRHRVRHYGSSSIDNSRALNTERLFLKNC